RGGRASPATDAALPLPRLLDDGREAAGERGRRRRPGELRDAGERDVDAVEQPALVLLRLAWQCRVDELVLQLTTAATWSAAAAESRQRRQTRSSLALVIAASVGANLGVGAAEQLAGDPRLDAGHARDACSRS